VICTTMAAFNEHDEARRCQRQFLRERHARVTVYLCPECDYFHIASADERVFPPTHGKEILNLIAQGFTTNEIAQRIDLSRRTVEKYVEMMRKNFYALSAAHLVAIAFSLGIINPNDFVPQVKEKLHA
jgi:DNA-binding CsgD family transcriptional regulator